MRKHYPEHVSFVKNRIPTLTVSLFLAISVFLSSFTLNGQSKTIVAPPVRSFPAAGSPSQPQPVKMQNAVSASEVSQKEATDPDWVNKNNQQPGGQAQGTPNLTKKWVANPFDHKIFVENKGQFDHDLNTTDKVLYYAKVGQTKIYFTAKGVVYRNDEITIKNKVGDKEDGDIGDEKKERNRYSVITPHYLSATWQGASPDVTLDAGEQQTYFYSYGVASDRSIQCNVFKKLTYKNIYPGIDIEYTFPTDKKGGIKYAVIVHPGADISVLKLMYDGAEDIHLDENGNVTEHVDDTVMKDLTDHAPVSFYEGGGSVNVNYSVSGRTESFVVKDGYDNTRTLVIDPWTTSITFASGYNAAYDLDYDYAGNVYVYGGWGPFQLTKLNSAGVVQWTYNTTWSTVWLGAYYEGDFAVDKVTGTSYIGEGLDNNTGATAIKVNTNAVLKATYGGSTKMYEIWRMTYNPCSHQIVIGGGGTNTPSSQVCMLDTSMVLVTPVNPLGTGSCCHDVDRLCMDPTGATAFFHMGTPNNGPGTNASSDNILMSVPVPALTPANYVLSGSASTGSALVEVASIQYVGPGYQNFGGGEYSCYGVGMNGMAASPNWLYCYDGYTVQRRSKATGAFSTSVAVSARYNNYWGYGETDVYWGGLAADACDNVYVGTVTESGAYPAYLNAYNSALALQSSTALPNWPYDVKLGANNATLYVCGGPDYLLGYSGDGYVEAFTNAITTVATTSATTPTTCGASNGSATATLSLCGTVQGGVTYLWEPGGQTTQTATNLAAGTYTVSMNIGCGFVYQATAVVAASVNVSPTSASATSNSPVCAGSTINLNGSATNATSYSWTGPNSFTSAVQNPTIAGATAAMAGTYILTAHNACGTATSSVSVTVNPVPTLTATASPTSICAGASSTLTAGGATTYSWSTGATTSTIVVTPATTTTYTLNGSSAGCAGTAVTVTVTVNQLPTLTATAAPTSICPGGSSTLTAGGGSTYVWSTGATTSTIVVIPATTTTYTLNGSSAAGCAGTLKTVTVTVNPTPTLTATAAPVTICAGASSTLTAGGGSTYTWNTGATTSTIVVTPAVTTIYTLNGSSAAGCAGTATTVTVNVNPLPVLTATAAPATICAGSSSTLTAGGASTYTWSTGATTTTIVVSPAVTTIYTLNGTSAAGCAGTLKTVTVTVNPLPVLTATAAPASICPGGSSTLTAGGGSTYTWSTGATTTTIVVSPASTTTYTLNGSAATGCAGVAKTVTVTVNPTPVLTATAAPSPICPGSSSTLTAGGGSTYTWSTGATTTTISVSPVVTTTYTLNGSSAAGCAGVAKTVTVTVNPTPTITIAPAAPTICPGGNVTLTANGGTSTYSWSTGATTSSINVTPAVTTTYTVNGNSAAGCPAAPVTVTVTVAATLAVTITPGSPSICIGSSITLDAGGAATYTWKPSATLSCSTCPNPLASPTVTTTYTVYGASGGCTDSAKATLTVNPTPTVSIAITGISAAICPGDSLGMIAGTANTYSWSPTTGLSCTSCASVTAGPTVTTVYTVTGTDAGGCTATATQMVTVYPQPVMTLSPTSATLCNGGSVTLTAGGVITYTWAPAAGLNPTTGTTVLATPTVTTDYVVTGKGTGGCPVKDSALITVNPVPVISVSPAAPFICPADSVTLNALGGNTYSWSPSGGLSCNICPSPIASPGGTITYKVVGTSAAGCKDSTNVTVTVNPTPTLTIASSAGSTICSSDTTKLTAGGGGATYTWAPATGLSASTGTTVNAFPSVTTTYTLSSVSASGCNGTDSITITVNPTPTLVLTATNDSLCSGGTVTVSASGASLYTWTPSSSLSAATGAIVNASPTVTTTYTVTGTSVAGCPINASILLTVTPTPTLVVTPASPGICPGDSITLHATGATTYTWNTGATTDSLRVGPATSTTYTVTGNNGACSSTATDNVHVGILVVTATASSSTLCSGTTSTLTASGAITYAWKPGTGLSATTGTSVTATPSVSTIYTVVGISGSGCSDSGTVSITVNPTPTLNIAAGSTNICFGTSGTTLTATGANSYSWSPVTGLSSATDSVVTANAGTTLTYTVTGNTAAGCSSTASVTISVDKPVVTAVPASPNICVGGSTTITATGGTSYIWYPNGGLSATTGATVTADSTGTAGYWVVGTDALGCKDSANVNIVVNPLPTITASASDTSLCTGNSTTLIASGGSTFTWSPSAGLSSTVGSVVTATPTTTTTYIVTGTSVVGCVSTASVNVTVNSSPAITIALSGSSTLCPGGSVTMTASGGTTYIWSPSSSLSASTGASVVATPPTSPVIYTVVGLNGVCSDSATETINLYPPLTVGMTPGDTICAGRPTTITATAVGGDPAYTYTWAPPIGTSTGPYVVNPTSSTTYTCTITDACGSVSSGTMAVFAYPLTKASFYPTPDTVFGGGFISFIDSSTGATSWHWTFGDGNTSTLAYPYDQYIIPGGYLVTLIVSNPANGCADTAYDSVHVIQKILIPNVFTPNGDGQNDVFHVTVDGMKTYSIEIFNRWGEKVFTADSPEIDWDGTSTGGVQESDGTYYYLIKMSDYKGKLYTQDGYIQLIR